jgi:hypothetical protein
MLGDDRQDPPTVSHTGQEGERVDMPIGRPKSIERMTARELAEMEARVKRARIIKENHHKDMLRAAITKMVKENGFDVKDLISR